MGAATSAPESADLFGPSSQRRSDLVLALVVILITFLTFFLIVTKTVDPRLAFATSGLCLWMLAGHPLPPHAQPDEWQNWLLTWVTTSIVIASAFGFASVVREEQYTHDLIQALLGIGRRAINGSRSTVIVLTIIATFLTSMALLSANAACAVVAPVMIPLLLELGLPGPIAAGSIVSGAWGPILSPGDVNAENIEVMLKGLHAPLIVLPRDHWMPTIIGLVVIAVILAFHRSRGNATTILPLAPSSGTASKGGGASIRWTVPLIPFVLLLGLGVAQTKSDPGREHFQAMAAASMILGTIGALGLASRCPRMRLLGVFARGSMTGIADVVVLIIASKFFIAGLILNTAPDAVANLLHAVGLLAPALVTAVTFMFAVITGSGDAIVTSMVNIVVPAATKGGIVSAPLLASMIWFGGEMGRCASPISAATITTARIAKVSTGRIAFTVIVPVLAGVTCCFIFLLLRAWGPT